MTEVNFQTRSAEMYSRNFPNTCFYGWFWAECTQIESTYHPGTFHKFVYIWQKSSRKIRQKKIGEYM